MAGKRDEWHLKYVLDYGYAILEDDADEPICLGLLEEHARQIVREHNLHQRLVDACKLALEELCGGCLEGPERCRQPADDANIRPHECYIAKLGNALRNLIAETKKG
jgi:hypothetical protein